MKPYLKAKFDKKANEYTWPQRLESKTWPLDLAGCSWMPVRIC